MKSGLAFFEWERPAKPDTFRWEMRQVLDKPALTLVAQPGAKFIRYCPLDRGSTLSEDFVLAKPNTDELLGLANRYGRLESHGMDTFDTWCEAVKRMRFVETLTYGRTEDYPNYSNIVEWKRGQVTVAGEPLYHDLYDQFGMAAPKDGDVRGACILYARQLINYELSLHVHARDTFQNYRTPPGAAARPP